MERRFQQYAFIAAAALAGAVYGAACDLVTSSISPEYFAIAKHTWVAGAPWRAALIGARAGASGGATAALVLVVADEPRWGGAGVPWRALARAAAWIVAASAVCAIAGGSVGGSRVALPISLEDVSRLGVTRPSAFRGVWAAHAGAYVGGIAATLAQAIRARFRAGPASPASC